MSQFKKFEPCCTYEPPSKYHDGYTGFELINKLIEEWNETVDELNEIVNSLNEFVEGWEDELALKEDSSNITINRKLSPYGDFTGTWFGDTKANVDSKIAEGLLLYQQVIELLNSSQYNIVVVNGGWYADGKTPVVVDDGTYTGTVVDSYDDGRYLIPCQCN